MKGEAWSATGFLCPVRHEISALENEVKCQGHGSRSQRKGELAKSKPSQKQMLQMHSQR